MKSMGENRSNSTVPSGCQGNNAIVLAIGRDSTGGLPAAVRVMML